ncbi:hypothetical protein SESBI_15235 [Sesbania bispinosa]|nr:hypothetical protein SESBI_15235 [Sesbania bispinosa]
MAALLQHPPTMHSWEGCAAAETETEGCATTESETHADGGAPAAAGVLRRQSGEGAKRSGAGRKEPDVA